MNRDDVWEYDPTCWDDDEAAAYDRAALAHQKAQALEDRTTGQQLDPMPTFDEWTSTGGDDAEC